MKFLIKLIYILLFLITIIGFYESLCSFNFAEGSDSGMELSKSSIWIKLLLIILLGFLMFRYLQKNNHRILLLIITTSLLWTLSGRTIGVFSDGRIYTGWFYVKTNSFDLCVLNDDCETIFYNQTKIEKLSFWRIRIKNKNIDKVIFIGPFTWNETLEMFPN